MVEGLAIASRGVTAHGVDRANDAAAPDEVAVDPAGTSSPAGSTATGTGLSPDGVPVTR